MHSAAATKCYANFSTIGAFDLKTPNFDWTIIRMISRFDILMRNILLSFLLWVK